MQTKREVALCGYGFRFPGEIHTPEAFWSLLVSKGCVSDDIPSEKFNGDAYHAPNKSDGSGETGKFCGSRIGSVKSSRHFDASFFNISAEAAAAMDPQQRMFITCVVEALERAGVPLHSLRGSNTGVWVGTSVMEYLAYQTGAEGLFGKHTNPGVALCVIANRTSFFLGTRGPSMAVDTACASAITAMDIAMQAIQSGQCDMAIVGGTNAIMIPEMSVGYSNMGVMSSDGRCKPFDASANGYARSEGFGCVVLTTLSRAKEQGYSVQAILRACSSNAAGDLATGLTKPSAPAQVNLIKEVWQRAELPLHNVTYVEAHGTGTAVGDPIEAEAIGLSFGIACKEIGRAPVPICSNKANLGHMEPAAGMASVIKACLMIHHRKLIPQAAWNNPHPDIQWNSWNIRCLTEVEEYTDHAPITIAINAFGFGGSNSHLIVQEPPRNKKRTHALITDHNNIPWSNTVNENQESEKKRKCDEITTNDIMVLPLSATNVESLRLLAGKWATFESDNNAKDVIARAALHRSHHMHRVAIIASSVAELRSTASKFAISEDVDPSRLFHSKQLALSRSRKDPCICIIFSGQGPQYADMGRVFYKRFALFKEIIHKCDEIYTEVSGESFLEKYGLFTPDSKAKFDMDKPEVAQPAIVFFQVALFEVIKYYCKTAFDNANIVLVGHSLGEISAAYAAGKLSMEEMVRLIYVRATQQQRTENKGAMLAVACACEQVERIIKARGLTKVFVAAVNNGSSVTVAGDVAEIKSLRSLCKDVYGIQSAILGVRCAFHSYQMDEIKDDLISGLQFLQPSSTKNELKTHANTQLYSTATPGKVADDVTLDAQYWWKNVRGVVEYHSSMEQIISQEEPDFFLEIAPRAVLNTLTRQLLNKKGLSSVPIISSAEKGIEESRQVWATLAKLYTFGLQLEWPLITQSDGMVPMDNLPLYPFRGERFLKCNPTYQQRIRAEGRTALQQKGGRLSFTDYPWLRDHKVAGNCIVPGTCFIEFLLENLAPKTDTSPVVLCDVQIVRALPIVEDESCHVRVVPRSGGWLDVVSEQNHVHCNARIPLHDIQDELRGGLTNRHTLMDTSDDVSTNDLGWTTPSILPLDFMGANSVQQLTSAVLDSGKFTHMTSAQFYALCNDMTYQFGPWHANITNLYVADEEAIFSVKTDRAEAGGGFRFHPAIFDACVHGVLVLVGVWSTPMVPVSVSKLLMECSLQSVLNSKSAQLVVHCRVVSRGQDYCTFDIAISEMQTQSSGQPRRLVAYLQDVVLRTLTSDANQQMPNDVFLELKNQVKSTSFDINKAVSCSLSAQDNSARQQELKLLLEAIPEIQQYVGAACKVALECPGYQQPEFRECVQRLADMASSILIDKAYLSTLMDNLKSQLPFYNVELQITELLCNHLNDIMADPSVVGDYIYRPNLLPTFFRNSFTVDSTYVTTAAAVEELVQQKIGEGKSVVRVLEIGLRTGGLTTHIAKKLKSYQEQGLVDYHSTDVSSTFLADAAEVLKEYPWVKLSRFNIEQDPAQQGFEPSSFDIIVIMSTLHGVTDIPTAISQIRAVCAPGAAVINIEPSESQFWWLMELWFGSMEVWWRFKDNRRDPARLLRNNRPYATCWMSRGEWLELFKKFKFTDIQDVDTRSFSPLFNTLICRAPSHTTSPVTHTIYTKEKPFLVFTNQHKKNMKSLDIEAVKTHFQNILNSEVGVYPIERDVIDKVMPQVIRNHGSLTVIVHVAADQFDADENSKLFLTCLHLTQYFKDISATPNKTCLCFVTEGASSETPSNPYMSFFQGFSRAVASEFEKLNAFHVDLDPLSSPSLNTQLLIAHLEGENGKEGEVIFRNQSTVVPRLHRYTVQSTPTTTSQPEYVRLETQGGSLEAQLTKAIWQPAPLQDFEVEISVDFAALNFKDVLSSLGMLDALQSVLKNRLGFGCYGSITRCGEGVKHVSVGDHVVALATDCFASHTICDSRLVVRAAPSECHVSEAVLSCITLYATACEAVINRANTTSDDVILIHSATSGVGHCAIQLAKHIGATIIATAGTPQKRELLRAQGVQYVTDSRDSDVFHNDVIKWTKNRGVDVVLNCLTGKARAVSVSLLAPSGRFIDISKRDMLEDSHMSLKPLLRNTSLLSCQLDIQAHDKPTSITRLLTQVLELFKTRVFLEIPVEIYELGSFSAAAKKAAKGEVIEKAVFQVSSAVDTFKNQISSSLSVSKECTFKGGKACYIITGGLGGLGISLAHSLATRGASNIILLTRDASKISQKIRHTLHSLTSSTQTHIYVRTCDVSKLEEVQDLINVKITKELGLEVKGIFHLAVALEDGLIINQDDNKFLMPIRTKAIAAFNLHNCTKDMGLDVFLATTSTQDLSGIEQSNYTAADLITQQLIYYRRSQGLAGVCVGLGPMLGAGMVERDRTVAKFLSHRGADFINVHEAVSAIVHFSNPLLLPPPFVMMARLDRFLCSPDTPLAPCNQKWLHFIKHDSSSDNQLSAEDALTVACKKLSEIFCVPLNEIDPSTPLIMMGVDSLVATELRNFFANKLHITVSYTDILSGINLTKLLSHITNN